MKEYKIGDTFCLEDGTKLEVIKATCNCKNCYFFNYKDNSCSRTKDIVCSAPRREDKEFVIFKQVKDNNMEEKRSIQISLEEAREWYNSGNSFKRELALKAYSKEELEELDYTDIVKKLPSATKVKNTRKGNTYIKLLDIADYLNNRTPKEYNSRTNSSVLYYILGINNINPIYSYRVYKGFIINKTSSDLHSCVITFNSEKAAKKAIDILGDELKILFE